MFEEIDLKIAQAGLQSVAALPSYGCPTSSKNCPIAYTMTNCDACHPQ